jgi:hypothetical protein
MTTTMRESISSAVNTAVALAVLFLLLPGVLPSEESEVWMILFALLDFYRLLRSECRI